MDTSSPRSLVASGKGTEVLRQNGCQKAQATLHITAEHAYVASIDEKEVGHDGEMRSVATDESGRTIEAWHPLSPRSAVPLVVLGQARPPVDQVEAVALA